MVLGDLRIEELATQCYEGFDRASSSAPISREYPATSAARIAARRRVWLILQRPRLCGAPRKQILYPPAP